jgi:broad specificity phosphatase PhoE
MKFAKVFTSPLQRASRTCELAGFVAGVDTDRDLVEWDYGQYEGTASFLRSSASPKRQRRRTALFQWTLYSGVIARWLALAPESGGKHFLLNPASLSAVL